MDISVFYLTFRAQEAMEIQTNQTLWYLAWRFCPTTFHDF